MGQCGKLKQTLYGRKGKHSKTGHHLMAPLKERFWLSHKFTNIIHIVSIWYIWKLLMKKVKAVYPELWFLQWDLLLFLLYTWSKWIPVVLLREEIVLKWITKNFCSSAIYLEVGQNKQAYSFKDSGLKSYSQYFPLGMLSNPSYTFVGQSVSWKPQWSWSLICQS